MQTVTPIITIDGPSGSGKGTIAGQLAKHLNWHLLDSGALYRVLAYAIELRDGWAKAELWADIAAQLPVSFKIVEGRSQAHFEALNIERQIRSEEMGALASKVAADKRVREALLRCQRCFAKPPGLVADGRDMGTKVFPQAPLKVFLTASAEVRAQRRYLQLKQSGENVSLAALLNDIKARDDRDINRSISPLVPASDAIQLDSSDLSIDEVLHIVLDAAKKKHLSSE